MPQDSYEQMWKEEEKLKEEVYSFIDHTLTENWKMVDKAKEYVDSGAFDDHDAFTAHNALADASRNNAEAKKQFLSIFPSPYFAHMAITDEDGKVLQIMLSDSADLDQVISIGSNKQIVPFKQSAERPMLSMLFHQYQVCKLEPFTVPVTDKKRGAAYKSRFNVELIRNVDIQRRHITDIRQLAPELNEEDGIQGVDELLAHRLDENRGNAKLRNIIATLQREQFDIIRTDIAADFVVQGCAGSGKTQCLIHRLFFLRDVLGDMGWDKVLLITPTQLFRNYSMELIRRYHLENIANCSLAFFYCTLLNAFDSRFKNRQYSFELTEEYLPDRYLRRVYAPEQIVRIETEIRQAILNHVREGCKLLDIACPEGRMTTESISGIVQQIEEKIAQFDQRTQEFSKNAEYTEHLGELDKIEKRRTALHKRQKSLEDSRLTLNAEKKQYDKLKHEMQKAEAELAAWKESVDQEIDHRIATYLENKKDLNNSQRSISEYRRALSAALDAYFPFGQKYQLDKDNAAFLNDICMIARDDLEAYLSGQTEEVWLHGLSDKVQNNIAQRLAVQEEFERITTASKLHTQWIQEFTLASDSIETQRKTYRVALEKSRYYLSRIESNVFEQEVWRVLEPLKTECGIKTLKIQDLDDGHQKQTRILYKSDLLFYVMIYAQIHGKEALPEYNLICIDEGQDLHSADYKMLRELYPNAALNIFGDTAQVLHESCGITDWTKDTGINMIYTSNNNYRNTPAIVDFCNRQFGCDMAWVGKIQKKCEPRVLKSTEDLRACIAPGNCVVIIKTVEEFEAMCAATGLTKDRFDFLDMKSDKETARKIHCYSVFAAKGLEFPSVLVYAKNMNRNQKTVACTRAMEQLYYFG